MHVHDVDHERGAVMVREGKGKRDRLIPIGERALAWIRKYLDEVRPQIALGNDEGTLLNGADVRFVQARPNRLLKRVYGQKEVVTDKDPKKDERKTLDALVEGKSADERQKYGDGAYRRAESNRRYWAKQSLAWATNALARCPGTITV